MAKDGGFSVRDERSGGILGVRDSIKIKKKLKRNMQRLGGKGGLSLESFANAKTRNDNYNPALIKKKREFYKNAKYVSKYKRSIKRQDDYNVPSTAERPQPIHEGENQMNRSNKKSNKSAPSLEEMYKKKREEEEKAQMEKEATMQAKKEAKEQSEARRKCMKGKMMKKTRSGQPVMKYRIENILETIQGTSSN